MSIRILFFVLIFLAGCKDTVNEIPAGIIARDSMVTIMADIHVAESQMARAGGKGLDKDVRSVYLHKVLSAAGTDTTRFMKSFDFYSTHPEIFAEMYEQVVVEISKRQAEKNDK